jgi:DNA-binding MarR family transcriptional regulator
MNEEAHVSRTNRNEEDDVRQREIVTIARALDDWYTLLGRQFGPLSRSQRRMLRLLNTVDAVRVGDLAEKLGLTTAGATRMLDKLESFHYAARSRDPRSDQRQVYVTMTPAGQEALRQADDAFLARIQETLGFLASDEQSALAHLLHTMQTRALEHASPKTGSDDPA